MAADEDTVAVTVRDHGVGLRPGEAGVWPISGARIPHGYVDPGGTGLGLAISVEDARCTRSARRGANPAGACFRRALPLVRGPQGHHQPALKPIPQPVLQPVAQPNPQPCRNTGTSAPVSTLSGRLMRLTILLFLGAVLAGCASNCPASAPASHRNRQCRPDLLNRAGMDPGVLLGSSRPLANRPGGASVPHRIGTSAWDDAGSALLIDHVVFVETRSAEKVSVTMRANRLALGWCLRPPGQLPDRARSSWSRRPMDWRSATQRGFPGLAVSKRTSAAPVLHRPHRQDRGSRSLYVVRSQLATGSSQTAGGSPGRWHTVVICSLRHTTARAR